jgi:hypothetical protein
MKRNQRHGNRYTYPRHRNGEKREFTVRKIVKQIEVRRIGDIWRIAFALLGGLVLGYGLHWLQMLGTHSTLAY